MSGIRRQPAKRSMQDVQFSSVEEFLEYLPNDQRIITERLRELIFDTIPGITEKLSYNVPFFRKHRNICFIWPSAVPWGGMKQRGVRLGFTSGNLLRDESGYLDKGDRKQVYWKDFYDVSDVDADMVRMFLFEAAAIDSSRTPAKK